MVVRSSSKCDADDSASELKRFAERVLLEGGRVWICLPCFRFRMQLLMDETSWQVSYGQARPNVLRALSERKTH